MFFAPSEQLLDGYDKERVTALDRNLISILRPLAAGNVILDMNGSDPKAATQHQIARSYAGGAAF